MSDQLYQDRIVALAKAKTGAGKLLAPTRSARRDNPLCGDRLTVYLKLDGDVIREAAFEGSGCAISKASASLMTDAIKGTSVPDARAFCFTQAYQSIGLGLASAIGAALAQPDRLPVAALGDGGALMGVSELETVVRLRMPMVIVVYDDEAYGAEVHHFGPDGHALDTVRFPPADIAAIGRGFGCAGVTIRGPQDLAPVREWLAGPRDRPLVIDAKVTSDSGSWWLEEAFRGH